MSKYVIKADEVDFKNPYSNKDIILKHEEEGFALIFDSKVKFRYNTQHSKVSIGTFDIQLGNSGESLEIHKKGQKLFSLSPSS